MATRKEQAQQREEQHEAIMTRKEFSNHLLSRYMENLNSHLENKKAELCEEIEKYLINKPEKKHLSTAIITKILSKDFKSITQEPIYSATELAIVFEYYQDFIYEINIKGVKFPPSKQNFCMFAGLTTRTYDAYLNHNDEEKRTVTQRIEDYINEVNWTSAQNEEQNAYVVEKRTKLKGLGGGYSEAKGDMNINITNQVKSVENMEDFLDKLKTQGLLGK